MLAFRYRAAHADGSIESGTIRASTRDEAAAAIKAQGAWVLDVQSGMPGIANRRGPSLADLGLGLRLFASLLESGIPLPRALGALEEMAPETWAPALPTLRAAVQRGDSLTTALASAPLGLPPVVIGIMRAGEAGSGLAQAVRRSATLMESRAATRAAVRAALAYPAILATASLASMGLLVGVVLPRFAAIVRDLGQALPPTTQALLSLAQLARELALPGIVGLAIALIAWHRWVSTTSGRLAWHSALLSAPAVGGIRRAGAAAGFASALSALLESGVPIGAALRSAAEAAGDAAMAERITKARERIVQGSSIAASLAAEDAGTPTMLRLVHAGEESGRLAELLSHAAVLEHERADRALKSFVRLLEPALILAFGGLVAFVAAALLQAVYSVRPGA